jgi:predicted  nucleic acid-binding Zn-ribbon protein
VILAQEQENLKKELQGLRGLSKKQHDRCEEIRRRLGDLAGMLANTARNSNAMENNLRNIDRNISTQIEKLSKDIDSKLRLQFRGTYH